MLGSCGLLCNFVQTVRRVQAEGNNLVGRRVHSGVLMGTLLAGPLETQPLRSMKPWCADFFFAMHWSAAGLPAGSDPEVQHDAGREAGG